VSRLASAFEAARREGRAAFIPYLTAGDPSPRETVRLARALAAAGADILELGVPFSDPIADGPVLQRSAQRALAAGTSLPEVFAMARRIRRLTPMPLLLFTYLNPLLRRGVARAAAEARRSGFDGVLVTDLPPEEAGSILPGLRSAGLDVVFLVSPGSPSQRMRRAAESSSGFLYVVSRPGTTGVRNGLPPDLSRTVQRARRAAGGLPIAVGFGIGTPDAAGAAARLADGVVVGSAIVRAVEGAGAGRLRRVTRLARSLARACRRR
jgi:tryptophan synthase alpha chain